MGNEVSSPAVDQQPQQTSPTLEPNKSGTDEWEFINKHDHKTSTDSNSDIQNLSPKLQALLAQYEEDRDELPPEIEKIKDDPNMPKIEEHITVAHSSTSRGFVVTVINDTDRDLELIDAELFSGGWSVKASPVIKAFTRTKFGTHSISVMSGTDGKVLYVAKSLEKPLDNAGQFDNKPTRKSVSVKRGSVVHSFILSWNNPYFGSSNFDGKAQAPYSIVCDFKQVREFTANYSFVTFHIKSQMHKAASTPLFQSPDDTQSQLELKDLQDAILKAQKDSSRSFEITIINSTTLALKRDTFYLSYGVWSVRPPEQILPKSIAKFGSHSTGVMVGTEGSVKFFSLEKHYVFFFKWDNPYFGTNGIEKDCSEQYIIECREFRDVKEMHTNRAYATFFIKERSSLEFPSLDTLNRIKSETYFNKKELRYLFEEFMKSSNNTGEITPEIFVKLFPQFNNEYVLKSLFRAFASQIQNDGKIDFEEYVRVLSIMTRGDLDEKITLAFKLCDLDGNGNIERDEVLQIAIQLGQILQLDSSDDSVGYGYCDNPEEVVNNLFNRGQTTNTTKKETKKERKERKSKLGEDAINIVGEAAEPDSLDEPEEAPEVFETVLTEEQFIERAKLDPDLAECYGLFSFFYRKIILPMEKKLESSRVIQYAGWLHKDKDDSLVTHTLGLTDKRFFVVRDSFFAYYQDDKPESRPINVISLQDSVVKEGHKNEFHLLTPFWSRTLYATNKQEKRKWVNVIRANIRGGNRFKSFAPVRKRINCKWYINGKDYFQDMIPAILGAKSRIFIADWYFSPALYLSRDQPLNDNHRIDNMLLKKAKQGVKIFILIWNAAQLAFDLRTQWVADCMNELHENIYCLSHPYFTPMLWSHHQKFVVIDESTAFLGGIDICFNRYDDTRYLVVDPDEETFPGRDYSNFGKVGESNGPAHEAVVDRTKHPRMPWHDIAMALDGLAAKDVAYNFIQRWNHAMNTNSQGAKPKGNWYLIPGHETLPSSASNSFTRRGIKSTQESQLLKEASQPRILLPQEVDPLKGYAQCNCQIIRSASNWSAGLMNTERSIYKAYTSAIKKAQHFIYIENQYFISSINRIRPKNKILAALYERLRTAIQNKEDFRVYVLIPVYPAGNIEDITTRYIIKYIFKTISRQGNSIKEKLKSEFPDEDVDQRLCFFSLRNYGVLGGSPVTEQVYIHAKMMLVDDRVAIIGSANINDRSMVGSTRVSLIPKLGTRDSEICAFVEQPQTMVDGVMNGKPFKVSSFARDLRIRLWKDYLGMDNELLSEKLADPLSEETHKLLCNIAQNNTLIYKSVFPSIPENVKSLSDIRPADPRNTEQLHSILGFLVMFPMDFFELEQMSPTILHKEFVMPRYVFL